MAPRSLFYAIFCLCIQAHDALGGQSPRRIASCSLATDEIALELLQRAHHLSRLVAVSKTAESREYSNITPVPVEIKGRCGSEVESLLALTPDLILLAPYTRPEFVRQVEAAKIKTFTTQRPVSLDAIETTIEQLGEQLGQVGPARDLLADFRNQRINWRPRQKKTVKPRLLHVFSDGAFSGSETMFDAICHELGAINVVAEQGIKGWPKLSTELVVRLSPDLVVMAGAEHDRDRLLENIRSTPGLRDLTAVKEGRLVVIADAEFGSVSHHVLKGIKKLATALDTYAATKKTSQ